MKAISSPWALMLPMKTKPPKRYAMSLGNYRNSHHRINNQAKRYYEDLLAPQVKKLKVYKNPIKISFTIYPPSRRRYDLDNYGSVTAKYFQDTLVIYGKIKDDDASHIVELVFLPGSVDKKNPRIDIVIEETL